MQPFSPSSMRNLSQIFLGPEGLLQPGPRALPLARPSCLPRPPGARPDDSLRLLEISSYELEVM